MRYQSGKGILSGVVVGGVIIIFIISTLLVPEAQRWILAIAGIFWAAFLLWIWFGTYYELRDTHILARMGPFFQRIPYDRIISVKKVRTITTSMALSGDVIEIRYGRDYVTGTTYISPKERDGFLLELKRRCLNLKNGFGESD